MDWVALGREEALAYVFIKYTETGNGVVDISEVGGDAHPPVEDAPLIPSGGVLLTDRGRKNWEVD